MVLLYIWVFIVAIVLSVERRTQCIVLKWKDKKMKSIWMLIVHNAFFLFPFFVSIGPFVFQYDFDECARHSAALSELGLFALQKQLLFRHFLLQWLLLVDEIYCKTFFSSTLRISGWNGERKPKDSWIEIFHCQIGFIFRSLFFSFFFLCISCFLPAVKLYQLWFIVRE